MITDPFAPDCPEPIHRLLALIGPDAISEWMDGAPSTGHAIVMAAVALPCHLHGAAVRLMHEAGWCNEQALAEPCDALQELAELAGRAS
jgi:hypothetical protein